MSQDDQKKPLIVFIESPDTSFLNELGAQLIDVRRQIIRETGFKYVSILRGNYVLCLEHLASKGPSDTVVIMDHTTYSNLTARKLLLKGGAKKLYKSKKRSYGKLADLVKDCVRLHLVEP